MPSPFFAATIMVQNYGSVDLAIEAVRKHKAGQRSTYWILVLRELEKLKKGATGEK